MITPIQNKMSYVSNAVMNVISSKAVIISVIAMAAISNIPTASAGPITYASCMAGITASTMGAGAPAAWATCIPFLAPWCP